MHGKFPKQRAATTRTEPTRQLQIAHRHLQLLPRAPYEARFVPHSCIIGCSFDSQSGSHAFASDRPCPFQAKANGLAFVPAGCEVYSQSNRGGEYLRLSYDGDPPLQTSSEYPFSDIADQTATNAAHALRRELLSEAPDTLHCEQQLLLLEGCVESVIIGEYKTTHLWVSKTRLAQLEEYIEDGMDQTLSIAEVASVFGVSAGFFSRALRQSIGRTPHQYIVDRRLARARHLIQQGAMELSEIALACGFSSHSHMSELFRRQLGISPRQLR